MCECVRYTDSSRKRISYFAAVCWLVVVVAVVRWGLRIIQFSCSCERPIIICCCWYFNPDAGLTFSLLPFIHMPLFFFVFWSDLFLRMNGNVRAWRSQCAYNSSNFVDSIQDEEVQSNPIGLPAKRPSGEMRNILSREIRLQSKKMLFFDRVKNYTRSFCCLKCAAERNRWHFFGKSEEKK